MLVEATHFPGEWSFGAVSTLKRGGVKLELRKKSLGLGSCVINFLLFRSAPAKVKVTFSADNSSTFCT